VPCSSINWEYSLFACLENSISLGGSFARAATSLIAVSRTFVGAQPVTATTTATTRTRGQIAWTKQWIKGGAITKRPKIKKICWEGSNLGQSISARRGKINILFALSYKLFGEEFFL
jgi:hypothetical protein